MGNESSEYRPAMSDERIAELEKWHEAAYQELKRRGRVRMSYLGLDLVIPRGIFAPTPMSDLLGSAVLAEVTERDRVLDMGTGCGVNAILAARKSLQVAGVDINPDAIACAAANAERNGVANRTTFLLSDAFDSVTGLFDVMILDPPFRWFRPRDLLEATIADENYRFLTRFMREAKSRLTPCGRIFVFFGTSGDMAYLKGLIQREGFTATTVAERVLRRQGADVTYCTQRLAAARL